MPVLVALRELVPDRLPGARVDRRRRRSGLQARLAQRALDAIDVERGGRAFDEEARRHRVKHAFEREQLAVEVALAERRRGRGGEAGDDAGRLDAFRRIDLLEEVDGAAATQYLERAELVREERAHEERLARLRRPEDPDALLARPGAPELARPQGEVAEDERLVLRFGLPDDRRLRLADRLLERGDGITHASPANAQWMCHLPDLSCHSTRTPSND